MNEVGKTIQERFVDFTLSFLLLTQRGEIHWEEATPDNPEWSTGVKNLVNFSRNIKFYRVFIARRGETYFYLTKTSNKEPQLCIRERDKMHYPYKFIIQVNEQAPLIIDIISVASSSVIQEFYETVENIIEEAQRNSQSQSLALHIDLLKSAHILP